MKRLFPFILLALILASTASLGMSTVKTNEEIIQGTWQLRGENDGHAWFLEWTFDKGKFNLKGYPPLFQEGKYRILKTDGDKLTLELYEQKGNFGTDNSQIEIIINKKNDTLTIKEQGPFKREKKD